MPGNPSNRSNAIPGTAALTGAGVIIGLGCCLGLWLLAAVHEKRRTSVQAAMLEDKMRAESAFPDIMSGGRMDDTDLYLRGLDLEKRGELVAACAAFMASADMGDAKALQRKGLLTPRLTKESLFAAIRLARTLQNTAGILLGKGGIVWVTIPGGTFMMGSKTGIYDEMRRAG